MTNENIVGLSKVVLYQSDDGSVTVDVRFAEDNFWLTQKVMADLFGVQVPAINKHLKNIFDAGELAEDSVISKMETTAADGKNYVTQFYNLDAAIAVGYRVNSVRATHFRIWATNTLREYMVKGFVMNDKMLKNGRAFGQDYFDELLEKIREIRASERRAYQKLADVFEQCSSDYRSSSEETQLFFQIVQNHLHFAITGKTAATALSLRGSLSDRGNLVIENHATILDIHSQQFFPHHLCGSYQRFGTADTATQVQASARLHCALRRHSAGA